MALVAYSANLMISWAPGCNDVHGGWVERKRRLILSSRAAILRDDVRVKKRREQNGRNRRKIYCHGQSGCCAYCSLQRNRPIVRSATYFDRQPHVAETSRPVLMRLLWKAAVDEARCLPRRHSTIASPLLRLPPMHLSVLSSLVGWQAATSIGRGGSLLPSCVRHNTWPLYAIAAAQMVL